MAKLHSVETRPVAPIGDSEDEKYSRVAYRTAYETAKRQLAEVIDQQQLLEKRKLFLRKALQNLAEMCISVGAEIEDPLGPADTMERMSLVDEVTGILRAAHPRYFSPRQIRQQIADVGRDLGAYRNPQSAIHTILKRLVEAGRATQKEDDEGRQVYCHQPDHKEPITKRRTLSGPKAG